MITDARTNLTRLRYAADELQQLYAARAAVYDMLTHTTTTVSPTGTRQAGDVHRIDDALGALGELTEQVDEKILVLAGLRSAAIGWIYRLDDPLQRSVLMGYYVNCRRQDGERVTWDDVAADLHVSRRQVHRIHEAALAELEKVGIECHTRPVI